MLQRLVVGRKTLQGSIRLSLGLGNYRPIAPLLLQRTYSTSSDDNNNNNNNNNNKKKPKQSPVPSVEPASKKSNPASSGSSSQDQTAAPTVVKKKHDANGFPTQIVILPMFNDVAFPGLFSSPLYIIITSISNSKHNTEA